MPQFFRQKVLLVSTGGGRAVNKALEYLTELKYAGFQIVHSLGVTVMPWSPGKALRNKTNKDIRSAAAKFFASLQESSLPVPSLATVISFNFFKKASEDAREYLPADNQFYRELKDYYYPVKISFYKKVITALILKLAFFMMRDMGPELGSPVKFLKERND